VRFHPVSVVQCPRAATATVALGRRRPVSVLASVLIGGVALASLGAPARVARAQNQAAAPAAAPPADDGAPRKRRQPPPAVIPLAETQAAEQLLRAGKYDDAVAQSKAALNKNERYTPAMLVMAKAYYKLHKYEWTKKLWEMMQANGASDAEKSEIYQLLAFLEVDQKNIPGAIILFKKAGDARPDNAVIWNNLGAQYLAAKNYREAAPVLEKAAQLQPGFAKAHLNLGDAYRGIQEYEKSQAEYQRALQLFPNYADAVFNLGILYLDADKMPNMDVPARMNTAIQYFQRYRQMMGGTLPAGDPVDGYISEAQEGIKKEEKRLERQRKNEERERLRASKKAADDAQKTQGGAAAPGQPAAVPAPAAAPPK
jgi:tetratricopeptide (TPR) repeat protein